MAIVLHCQNPTSWMHCVLHPVHLKQSAKVSPPAAHIVTSHPQDAHELGFLASATAHHALWLGGVRNCLLRGVRGLRWDYRYVVLHSSLRSPHAESVKRLALLVHGWLEHGTHRDGNVRLFGAQTV
jgi:hypothetical protein